VTVVLVTLALSLLSTISVLLRKTREMAPWMRKDRWQIDVLRDNWRVIEHLPGIGKKKALWVEQLREQHGESECSWMRNLSEFMQRLKIPARCRDELQYQGRWLNPKDSSQGDRR
jgi:hypothetical protein